MPKVVDPAERQRIVVDATLAVIARGGLAAATLANIAGEAGLAIGSVRHYFTSLDELVEFTADALVTRIGDRLEQRASVIFAAAEIGDRFAATVQLLLEILPLDDVRTLESTVWLELTIAARTDARLAPSTERLHHGLERLVLRIIESGREGKRLRTDTDPAIEAERLHALLDGLALHGILARPADYAEQAEAVVTAQLASLMRPS